MARAGEERGRRWGIESFKVVHQPGECGTCAILWPLCPRPPDGHGHSTLLVILLSLVASKVSLLWEVHPPQVVQSPTSGHQSERAGQVRGGAADAGARRPASRSGANALSSGALVALHYPGRFHFNAHGVQVAGQQFPRVLGTRNPNGLAWAEIEHRGLAIGQRHLEAR